MFHYRRKRIAAFILAVAICISSSAVVSAKAAGTAGEVNADSVSLRSGPSTKDTVLARFNKGTPVTLVKKENDWYKITVEKKTGYMRADFITAKTKATSLKLESEGDDVKKLQTSLKNLGLLTGRVDGRYGPMTEKAVLGFQKKNNLVQDGIAGPKVQELLYAKAAPSTTTALRLGDSGQEVVKLQNALKAAGFYTGPANGKLGPLTLAALKKFQEKKKLKVDGIAGPEVRNMLYGTSSSSTSSSTKTVSSNTKAVSADQVKPTAGPDPKKVELLNWYDIRNVIVAKGKPIDVFDIKTGLNYQVRSFANGNHADVEPITALDTATMLRTYGGKWSWEPRSVWITINGRTIASAINGMPHGGQTIKDNNMNGQVCLHFLGSNVHNGNKDYAQKFQNYVMEAANAAKR